MPTLEIRRHAPVRDHVHLSPEGVRLARQVGAQMGQFERVYTSHITRTLETAVAMGFAVDTQLEILGRIDADVWAEVGHHERWSWEEPFAAFAQLIRQEGATARLGYSQQRLWEELISGVSESGRVLIISHGRIIEAGVVSCFPTLDHATWGKPFDKCEGVRLTFVEGRWSGIEFVRMDGIVPNGLPGK